MSSPLHLMQYHSRMAFAFFSVMLIQWPWNHSLQLSQPLSVGEAKKEIKVCTLPCLYPALDGCVDSGAVSVHHEAVDVWFPADTVNWCILPLHATGLRSWYRFKIRQVAILKSRKHMTTHINT